VAVTPRRTSHDVVGVWKAIVQIIAKPGVGFLRIALAGSEVDGRHHGVDSPRIRPEPMGPSVQ
jgi:hypothetical protein